MTVQVLDVGDFVRSVQHRARGLVVDYRNGGAVGVYWFATGLVSASRTDQLTRITKAEALA